MSQSGGGSAAVSRTYQYRKVMKPLLERKRRARINKCLEELKQLIMEAVQMNAEALAKLEKADLLELTVQHLHRLRAHCHSGGGGEQLRRSRQHLLRFRCGFQQCTLEVSRFLQRQQFELKLQQQAPPGMWRPW